MLEPTKVEFDYVNLYNKYQLGLTTWSPLAYGILSGKYTSGIPAEGSRLSDPEVVALVPNLAWCIAQAEKLKSIAAQLKVSPPQLAIAWCLSNKNVSSVILGASSLRQLEENLRARALVPLISEELKRQIAAGTTGRLGSYRTSASVTRVRARHVE